MTEDLALRILSIKFSATKFREGYDLEDVDDFLDRLVVAVRPGQGRREDVAALIDGAQFTTTTKFREGYDMADVDAFLADVRAEVTGERPTTSATSVAGKPGAQYVAPALSSSGPTTEDPTRGTSLFGWLLGRR